MVKIEKYHILIVILAGLIITMMFNYSHIDNLQRSLDAAKESGILRHRTEFKLYFIIYNSVFQVVCFYLFSFFNLISYRNASLRFSYKYSGIIIVVLANIALYIGVSYLHRFVAIQFFEERPPSLGRSFYSNTGMALTGIALAYLLVLWQKNRFAEVESIRLKEEKKSAELNALKDQISPHFFFNTLSSLSSVVQNEDKERVLEFIQEISKTYRYTLSSGINDLSRLPNEMDFAKSYLFLMHKRFGDKLIYRLYIGEKYSKFKLPTMSIQILIENAVNHNIVTQSSPLIIDIYIEDGMLCVKNNLTPRRGSKGLGLGLSNLSNRYKLLANRDIIIKKTDIFFLVKLPLL